MTKSKNTKRALLASVLSVAVSAAMLVGSTFAWFTDSVTSTGNIIKSGNLNVEMYWAEGKEDPATTTTWTDASKGPIFNYNLWEPGYTEARHIKISNEGSLALKYEIRIVPTDKVSELADVIDVYYIPNGQQLENRAALTETNKVGTLAEVLENPVVAKGHIDGKKDTTIPSDIATIALKMQESAGNDYMDMSIGTDFSIQLVATQYTKEKDSFDDQYDANAHAEAVFGKDIVDKLKDPAVSEVVAGGDIDMDSEEFIQPNGNVGVVIPDGKTLDLNKNTIIRPEGGSGNGLSFEAKTTGTVKNGTVFARGDMCAVDIGEGATVNFENMHFEGHGNEILKVRAKAGEKTTVIFRNCTFNNAPVTLSGRNGATEIDIQFVDCKFTGTYKMYDENGNALTDPYGNIHYTQCLIKADDNYLYGDIKIEGCTFDFNASESKWGEEAIELYGCNQREYSEKLLNVLLKDVTITGKKITPIEIDNRYKDGLVLKEEGTNRYIVDDVEVNYDGTKK